MGSVANFDPNTMRVRVTLQPDDALTGWIPLSSAWIGNGWGLFAPPNIGDTVDVLYTNGDINSGVVATRTFNQNNQPLPVPSGEFWLVHKLLQSLKMTNDGKIAITDGHGATIAMNGDGTITIQGATTFTDDATFEKDVQVNQTLTATVDVQAGPAGISLVEHAHTSASPGSPTSPPLP